MKRIIRMLIGYLFMIPLAVLNRIFAVFLGKERTVKLLGPVVTKASKMLQRFWPPKINDASEFDIFKSKLKGYQRIWGILYDYPIEFPDENTVYLPLRNCPFAEAMAKLGVADEYGHYMCQGDWEVANDNCDKWDFERAMTIATGGHMCDFTYKKIQKNR